VYLPLSQSAARQRQLKPHYMRALLGTGTGERHPRTSSSRYGCQCRSSWCWMGCNGSVAFDSSTQCLSVEDILQFAYSKHPAHVEPCNTHSHIHKARRLFGEAVHIDCFMRALHCRCMGDVIQPAQLHISCQVLATTILRVQPLQSYHSFLVGLGFCWLCWLLSVNVVTGFNFFQWRNN
jgi:hypothetical protein